MEVDNHQRWKEEAEECLKGTEELKGGEKKPHIKESEKENQRVSKWCGNIKLVCSKDTTCCF